MILRVRVLPNANSSELLGWEDHPSSGRHLRIRLQAPPVDGKANKALILFLAATLQIPKSRITLLKGHASRFKSLEIPDETELP